MILTRLDIKYNNVLPYTNLPLNSLSKYPPS